MALITMPSSPSFTQSEWGLRTSAAVSESPFTGHQQVYEYDRALWYAVLSLPPMRREQAVEWQAFLLKLRGRANTFLLGDPDAKSVRGTASSCAVASNGAVGDTSIDLTIGNNETINTGSYIQLGSAASAKLYMIVDDNTASSGGAVTVTIEPKLKVAITSSTTAVISNPKGVFRMDSVDITWSADNISNYGFSFSCTEAFS